MTRWAAEEKATRSCWPDGFAFLGSVTFSKGCLPPASRDLWIGSWGCVPTALEL